MPNNLRKSLPAVAFAIAIVLTGFAAATANSSTQKPTLGYWSLTKDEVNLGDTFAGIYQIHNYGSSDIYVWMGMSIRDPNGKIINDLSNDKQVKVSPGFYYYSRYFKVPSNVIPGLYDIALAIWPDQFKTAPYDSTGWVDNQVTVLSGPKKPTLDSWSLDKYSVHQGERFTASYEIHNYDPNSINVWLGLSIRDKNDKIINDLSNDKQVIIVSGVSSYTRFFDVPSSAILGSYDIALAIWPDQFITEPYASTGWVENKLTVSEATTSVSVDFLEPTSVTIGEKTTIRVKVTNTGTTTINKFWLGLDLHQGSSVSLQTRVEATKTPKIPMGAFTYGGIDFGSSQGLSLSPGSSRTFSTYYTFSKSIAYGHIYQAGTYTWNILGWKDGYPGQTGASVIDGGNKHASLAVQSSTISVSVVFLQPTTVTLGAQTQIEVEVRNTGTTTISKLWLGLDLHQGSSVNLQNRVEATKTPKIPTGASTYGGIDFGSSQGLSLSPGTSRTFLATYTFSISKAYNHEYQTGTYTWNMLAWKDGYPGEPGATTIDGSNKQVTLTIQTATTSVSVTFLQPSTVAVEEQAEIKAKVTNTGSTTIDELWLGLDLYQGSYVVLSNRVEATKTPIIPTGASNYGGIDFGASQGRSLSPGTSRTFATTYTFSISKAYNHEFQAGTYTWNMLVWKDGYPGEPGATSIDGSNKEVQLSIEPPQLKYHEFTVDINDANTPYGVNGQGSTGQLKVRYSDPEPGVHHNLDHSDAKLDNDGNGFSRVIKGDVFEDSTWKQILVVHYSGAGEDRDGDNLSMPSSIDQIATQTMLLCLHYYVYQQAYVLEHPPTIDGDNAYVDIWLAESERSGVGASAWGDNIIVYKADSVASTWKNQDWIRNLAHEYGHLDVDYGRFESPETNAEGYLYERLFPMWLTWNIERYNKDGNPSNEWDSQGEAWDSDGTKFWDEYTSTNFGMFFRDQRSVDLIQYFLDEGPSSSLANNGSIDGMRYFLGLALYVEHSNGPKIFAKVVDAMGASIQNRGKGFIDKYTDTLDSSFNEFEFQAEDYIASISTCPDPNYTAPDYRQEVCLKKTNICSYWIYFPLGTWELSVRAKGTSDNQKLVLIDTNNQRNSLEITSRTYSYYTFNLGTIERGWHKIKLENDGDSDIYLDSFKVKKSSEQVKKLMEGVILPNEVLSHVVSVLSNVGKVIFHLIWPGSDLDMILITPDGNIIDSVTARNDPNIEFISGDVYEYYIIQNPSQGDWKISIKAVEVNEAGEPYEMEITPVSSNTENIHLTLFFNKEKYILNEQIEIGSNLFEGNQPITNADINIEIQKPKGYVDVLVLYDDGENGDATIDDGIYFGTYKNTDIEGVYTVKVMAVGESLSGNKFYKEATGSLTVTLADITWKTAPPLIMESGKNYTVYWEIASLYDVTHTNIHFGRNNNPINDYEGFTPVLSGSPGQYEITFSIKNSGRYYFVVHAIVKNKHYYSKILNSDVGDVNNPINVSWVSVPQQNLKTNTTYTFSWFIGGGHNVQHTHLHWSTNSDPGTDYDGFSQVNTGKPGTYSAELTFETPGTYYIIVHSIIDGKHYYTSTLIFIFSP